MREPTALLPFVPSGADFDASRRLMIDLGFVELWTAPGLVGLGWGGAKFILQDYNERGFAENYMLKLEVPDLDAFWAELEPKRLTERFPGVRLIPPKDVPWGREVVLIDLAGVCWHIG